MGSRMCPPKKPNTPTSSLFSTDHRTWGAQMLDGVDATEQDAPSPITVASTEDRRRAIARHRQCPSARRRARGPDRGDGRGPGVDSPGLGAGSALRVRSVTRAGLRGPARRARGPASRAVCGRCARRWPGPHPRRQRSERARPPRGAGAADTCSACNLVTCLAGSHDIVRTACRMRRSMAGGNQLMPGQAVLRLCTRFTSFAYYLLEYVYYLGCVLLVYV
jgi:hypothetical protein